MSKHLRFTPNPAFAILLGAVIVVAGCCSEMAFRNEKSPPLSTLFSGLVPGLLLVAIIARASIQLRQLYSQMRAVQRSLVDLRLLSASLVQSVSSDRSNLNRLYDFSLSAIVSNNREVADRLDHVAVSFEHTHSIAQRLSIAVNNFEDSLHPEASHPMDRNSTLARVEHQHQAPAAMKLRTLPNGSLDRNQLVELR